MKNFWKKYNLLILIAPAIILLDQLFKHLVRTNLAPGETWMPIAWLAPIIQIVHSNNTGIAFSMFQGANLVFSALAAIITVGIIIYYARTEVMDGWTRVALSMMVGGAVGNLIDRLFFGQVTDYLSIRFFSVINLADACLTLGVGVFLVALYLAEQREKRAKSQNKAE